MEPSGYDRSVQARLESTTGPSIQYLAGLFDGEGNFTTKHYDGGSVEFRMQLGTAKPEESELFGQRFGGGVYRNKAGEHRNADIYLWVVTDEKAKMAAEELYPFLRGKKDQCRMFIEAITAKLKERTGTGSGCRYSESAKKEMQSFSEKIRDYNSV